MRQPGPDRFAGPEATRSDDHHDAEEPVRSLAHHGAVMSTDAEILAMFEQLDPDHRQELLDYHDQLREEQLGEQRTTS